MKISKIHNVHARIQQQGIYIGKKRIQKIIAQSPLLLFIEMIAINQVL